MKRIPFGIITLLAFVSASAGAKDIPVITSQVTDLANIIPEDQEALLRNEIIAFEKSSKHQFAVITVPTLNDIPVEDYALSIARQWKGGQVGVDDGFLLLFYPGDGTPRSGKIRTEVGRGMEYILTDFNTSHIQRNIMIPILKDKGSVSEKASKAILAGARALMKLGQLTPEQVAEFKAKEEAQRRKEIQSNKDAFYTVLMYIFGFILLASSGLMVYWLATKEKRKQIREQRRKEEIERDARLEIDHVERMRKQADDLAKKRRARDDFLAHMTPSNRRAYLEKEETDRRVAEQHRRNADARATEIRAQKRREYNSRNDSYLGSAGGFSDYGSSSSSSSSDSDSNSGYSGGGGGDFGGGGSTSDF